MAETDRIARILRLIAQLRVALDRLAAALEVAELGEMANITRRAPRRGIGAAQKPIPLSWTKAYHLYDEVRRTLPPPVTYKKVHDALMEMRTRNPGDRRYRFVPTNPNTFAQYVRGFHRAKGLPTHREMKSH